MKVSQLTDHVDRQALSLILIDQSQHLEGSIIVRTVIHEVVTPDLVTMARLQAITRTRIQPQTASFRLPVFFLGEVILIGMAYAIFASGATIGSMP